MKTFSLMRVRNLADIDLPTGFDGTLELPRTRRTLVNCFNAAGKTISRPGINELNDTGKVARGEFVWNGNLYQVSSNDLIRIDNVLTGAFTVVGTIAGFEETDHDIGFNHAVIIVKGGNGYTFDKTETLTQITNINFESSVSVTHINGRFVYIPANGDPAFFSDVGDGGTIQPESFFDAEELPDVNKVCFNFRNTLYIGGTDSFELFINPPGATDSLSFQRLQNGRIPNGYIGGILEYNETFLFVGREKDQDFGIYAISQGSAPKISNEAIDTILATYTQDELENAISSRFKWHGYDIATFTFTHHSFGYLGGYWFELKDSNGDRWEGGYIKQFNGKYYTAYSDKIGVLDDSQTDYGVAFEQSMNLAFEAPNNQDFSLKDAVLHVSQGYNSAIGSVSIELSHDNVLFTQPFYRPTGSVGQYSNQLKWSYPGGLGYYRGFVGVRFRSTENINFSATKVTLNV